jgi:ABC-type polysaccharide/polyol phosphate transport system ATPase subunit/SAM-dependent methyltransferase
MKAGSLSGPETSVAATEARDELRPLAIRATGLSKTFRIPHEARYTVRDYALHPFRRTTYETQRALADVSFEIAQGEFFGVIGRNGSGKSTLLKVVAGIYPPDTGTVEIGGKLSPFIELGVGFNPELSARDNVGINGTLLGLSPKEIEERFDDIIAFGELERFVDQKLKNFSSGMQLRLAYSIAIQVPFDILLLDEVLAVGDQNFQEKCFATFEDMRRSGKTVILVTHDLRAVARFCDRALLLRDGVVQATGEPDDVARVYLEQEKGRAAVNGRARLGESGSTQPVEPPATEEQREATMRLVERRWHGLTTDDLGLMTREDIFDVIKTQQQYVVEYSARAARLAKELRETQRDVEHLSMMIDTLTRQHYPVLPLPPERLRFGKRATPLNFLAQGIAAADKAIAAYGTAPERPILEWGCNAGRTYRWVAAYPAWREHYRGCDTDAESVEWLAKTLGVDARRCSEEPPLPYEDGSFSGILSLSMLTRIHPDMHRTWYEELHRILDPHAIVILGTQGPTLVPEGRAGDGGVALEVSFERNGCAYLPSGAGGAAFVSEEFTRHAIDGIFALEEYRPEGHGSSDLYRLRRLG